MCEAANFPLSSSITIVRNLDLEEVWLRRARIVNRRRTLGSVDVDTEPAEPSPGPHRSILNAVGPNRTFRSLANRRQSMPNLARANSNDVLNQNPLDDAAQPAGNLGAVDSAI